MHVLYDCTKKKENAIWHSPLNRLYWSLLECNFQANLQMPTTKKIALSYAGSLI